MRVIVRLAAALALGLLLAAASPTRVTAATTIVRAGRLQSDLLAAINALRDRHGLAPVRSSPDLRAAAFSHSDEMAQRGSFDHESPDGSPFWKRVLRYYRTTVDRYWCVGENLLWNTRQLPAATMLRLWMESPPHRRVLLLPGWRDVGISAIRALRAPGRQYARRDVTIVTVDFGVRIR